jgi:hypothetical protein
MASRFVDQQARQSEQTARQSQEVAAASRGLVEADAQARTKLIDTHAALQKELQAERAPWPWLVTSQFGLPVRAARTPTTRSGAFPAPPF